MRILADTNIYFSALLFPRSVPSMALLKVCECDSLVICEYIISELELVVSRKHPNLLPVLRVMLTDLELEEVATSYSSQLIISDPKDSPILTTALTSGVDIIISGDKHFLSLGLSEPRVITASEYLRLKNPKCFW